MKGVPFWQFPYPFWGNEFTKGENVKIIVQFESEDEIKKAYTALKDNGQVLIEFQKTFFGALHAEIVDKYGIQWILNYFIAVN
ncbi:MAG: hypothetical protein KGZ63_12555 [Clostridiales bacterium]|jgi:PhnB protein|nr:hypothetical protein [Clostridiales bacterium]